MAIQPLRGFCVIELGIAEYLLDQRREPLIVLTKLDSRVDVIMVMIGGPIIVEPGLNPLSEILVVIHRSVLPLPESFTKGKLITRLQPLIKTCVDANQAPQMNIVRKFMDQNTLGTVRITRKSK